TTRPLARRSSATCAAVIPPAPTRARPRPSSTRTSSPPTGSATSPVSGWHTRWRWKELADADTPPDHRRRNGRHERHADDPRGGARGLGDHAGQRRAALFAHGAAVLSRPLD